jgi:hypothetical protein
MNKLDQLLEKLVLTHAENCGLAKDRQMQMAKEISIMALRGYNTRAELISLVKKAMVA